MPVSQRFIDLLNLPVGALRRLGEQLNTEFPASATKWDMARALAQASREDLEAQSDGYLYAGSTSLSWFRMVPIDQKINEDALDDFYPLDGEALDDDDVRAALTKNSEGDPFSETSRPDKITREPKLVVARVRNPDYLMTFAIAKRVGHVIHNFETQEVLEDDFFAAVLRSADGTFEVRSSASRARRLQRTWLGDFARALDMQVLPVVITEQDVRDLHDEIGGRLDIFRGRDSSGTSIFEARQFEKADSCNDLYDEEEFEEAIDGLEPMAYDLLFDFGETEDIRMHVSTLNGSIFVRTSVPEGVIKYIYEALQSVKGS